MKLTLPWLLHLVYSSTIKALKFCKHSKIVKNAGKLLESHYKANTHTQSSSTSLSTLKHCSFTYFWNGDLTTLSDGPELSGPSDPSISVSQVMGMWVLFSWSHYNQRTVFVFPLCRLEEPQCTPFVHHFHAWDWLHSGGSSLPPFPTLCSWLALPLFPSKRSSFQAAWDLEDDSQFEFFYLSSEGWRMYKKELSSFAHLAGLCPVNMWKN